MMTGTIYKIKRNHRILNYSWKLEKLGFIKIHEDGNMKLSLEILPGIMLAELNILEATEDGEIKLVMHPKSLKILLKKLLKTKMNNGTVHHI